MNYFKRLVSTVVVIVAIFLVTTPALAQPTKVYVKYDYKVYISCSQVAGLQGAGSTEREKDDFMQRVFKKAADQPGKLIVGYYLNREIRGAYSVLRCTARWDEKKGRFVDDELTIYWVTTEKKCDKVVYR